MQNQPTDGILEEFRLEFLDCWRRVPNKGFFFILLAAWVGLFQALGNSTLGFIHSQSLLTWMWTSYYPSVSGDDGHGFVVPFLVVGILWWKRKELVSLPLTTWWPAFFLIGFGLFLHVLGYAIQQPRISIVGLFTGIYGLTGLAWGPGWLRVSFFPFILFAFSVPLGTLSQPITFRLRLLVCQIVEAISHFISIDVVRNGTNLIDPTGRYQYDVAAACSGIRSLVATVGLALIYGVLSFRTWWKRGVLIASAVPLAVIGNVVRLLTIVIAAEIGGQKWGDAVHEGGPAGIFSLLPYVPPFLGLIWLGHYLREPETVAAAPTLEPKPA
jgi:exosortase